MTCFINVEDIACVRKKPYESQSRPRLDGGRKYCNEPTRSTRGWWLFLLWWDETMSLWCWVSNGPFVHPPDDIWVNMEQWWRDIGRAKQKDSEKNPYRCHFVHHKSHMDWPGLEPAPPQLKVQRVTAWAVALRTRGSASDLILFYINTFGSFTNNYSLMLQY
jgi:hypothetical protein